MEKNLPRPARWDPAVLLVAVCALLFGLLVRNGTLAAVQPFSDAASGISFSYPALWMTLPSSNAIVTIVNPQSSGVMRSCITLTKEDSLASGAMLSPEKAFLVTRSQQFVLYRVLAERDVQTLAARLHEFTYVYADDPYKDDPARSSVPIIVKAKDLMFTHRGVTWLITYRADSASFDEDLPALQRVMETLSLQ